LAPDQRAVANRARLRQVAQFSVGDRPALLSGFGVVPVHLVFARPLDWLCSGFSASRSTKRGISPKEEKSKEFSAAGFSAVATVLGAPRHCPSWSSARRRLAGRTAMSRLLRKPQDALQLDKMEIAAKRHKRRKTIQFLCFLCLFAAQDPVFYLAAWSVKAKLQLVLRRSPRGSVKTQSY